MLNIYLIFKGLCKNGPTKMETAKQISPSPKG
jgi:hypothetical protein